MLVRAFQTIKDVAATSSKKEKESLLKRGDSPYLRNLLVATYDKFKTYRILQIEQPGSYNSVQPDTMEEFMTLCKQLASHTLGTNEAKVRIRRFLATNTAEVAGMLTNLLLRDLRAGIDEKTCNRAFPGLIPVFGIQLGYALDSWDRIKFPIVCDEKIDGIRCPGIYDGDSVRFYSRKGFLS